jgi:hypothetical protein
MEENNLKVKRISWVPRVVSMLVFVIICAGIWAINTTPFTVGAFSYNNSDVNCDVKVMEKFGAELNIEDIKSDENWRNRVSPVQFTANSTHTYVAYKFTIINNDESSVKYEIDMKMPVSPSSDELKGKLKANETATVYVVVSKFEQVGAVKEIADVLFY